MKGKITVIRRCENCGTRNSLETVVGSHQREMRCSECNKILATAETVSIGVIPFVGGPPVTTAMVINMMPRNTGGEMQKERKDKLKCPACKDGVENPDGYDGYCPHCSHPLSVPGNCGTKFCLTCRQEGTLPPEEGGLGKFDLEEMMAEGGIPDECLNCDAQDCEDCPVNPG